MRIFVVHGCPARGWRYSDGKEIESLSLITLQRRVCAVALITTTVQVQEGHTKIVILSWVLAVAFTTTTVLGTASQASLQKQPGTNSIMLVGPAFAQMGGGAETKIVGHCNLKRWTTDPPFQTRHALSKNKMSLSPPFSVLHLDCVAT